VLGAGCWVTTIPTPSSRPTTLPPTCAHWATPRTRETRLPHSGRCVLPAVPDADDGAAVVRVALAAAPAQVGRPR
jgi:hypothetical protein